MEWVIGVAVGIFAICVIVAIIDRRQSVKVGGKYVELSAPSRRLVKEFKQIPVEHRPYPVENLYAALHALDTAHPDVNDNHFIYFGYEGSRWFNWAYPGSCGHGTCEYQPYWAMHHEIDNLKKSIEEREHALAVAGVQPNLDRVKELTDAIRQETKIVQQVTKELI
jgi:hypothetical protein